MFGYRFRPSRVVFAALSTSASPVVSSSSKPTAHRRIVTTAAAVPIVRRVVIAANCGTRRFLAARAYASRGSDGSQRDGTVAPPPDDDKDFSAVTRSATPDTPIINDERDSTSPPRTAAEAGESLAAIFRRDDAQTATSEPAVLFDKNKNVYQTSLRQMRHSDYPSSAHTSTSSVPLASNNRDATNENSHYTFRESIEAEAELREERLRDATAGAIGGGTASQISGLSVPDVTDRPDSNRYAAAPASTARAASGGGVNMALPPGIPIELQSDAAFRRGARAGLVRSYGLNDIITKMRKRRESVDADVIQDKFIRAYEYQRIRKEKEDELTKLQHQQRTTPQQQPTPAATASATNATDKASSAAGGGGGWRKWFGGGKKPTDDENDNSERPKP